MLLGSLSGSGGKNCDVACVGRVVGSAVVGFAVAGIARWVSTELKRCLASTLFKSFPGREMTNPLSPHALRSSGC